jgi:sporulation protein YlmC with PRC-barrel domain
MQKLHLASFVVAAAFAAAPVMVPVAAVAASTNYTGTNVTNPSGATAPSQANPLLTDNGSVRVGKLIGTNVYNSQDQKLGDVDGVVIDKAGQPKVVISHNNKLVEVPWSKLQFGDAQKNSDNKVIIPGMSQDQFNQMQAFHYTARNNG